MGTCSSQQVVEVSLPHDNEHEIKESTTQGAGKTRPEEEKEENTPACPTDDFTNDEENGSDASMGSSVRFSPTNTPSGASTPTNHMNDDSSHHSHGSNKNRKHLGHSESKVGLGEMIDNKKEEGDLKNGMVHIEVPYGKPIEEVYEGVHDGPILGQGIAGQVRLITHRTTGVQYAVKCLDLCLVDTEEGLQQLREEIYIMCQLDHPNIVRLEEVYESEMEIYLVQELCLGGELFDRLDEQPDYHYTEAQCARLVKQMLGAVRYIHEKGIIHRDLKLENFLFSNTSAESELKMIDFGLGKHFQLGEVHHEAVGTPYTVAPEVIRGAYDERCDVWAIGVITYLLLSGEPPFGGCGGPETLVEVRSNILRGTFVFEPEDIWDNVSEQAKKFIQTLLVPDPCSRPTAGQAQQSTWMQEWVNSTIAHKDRTLNPNVVGALVNFKDYSDMRKLLCEVLSFTLLPDQIEDLRDEFEKMDIDGSGEISLPTLKKVLMANAVQGSLGALTEAEVEGIFDAMRVRKTETTIHWHEFIAAGLSQCKVDDRNLKLAFDRLDSEHKGYITFKNMMDLMGHDPDMTEGTMQRIWGDSMGSGNFKDARITYDAFLLLMKGQTLDGARLIPGANGPLHTVAETSSLQEEKTTPLNESKHETSAVATTDEGSASILLGDNNVLVAGGHINESKLARQPSLEEYERRLSMGSICSVDPGYTRPSISISAPNTPHLVRNAIVPDNLPELNINMSMEEEEEDEFLSAEIDKSIEQCLLMPLSGQEAGTKFSLTSQSSLATQLRLEQFTRGRSKSVDEQDDDRQDLEDERQFIHSEFHDPYNNKFLSTGQKKRYQVHRQMRLSVLESSKLLEEEQFRRARETLEAQRLAEKKASGVRVGAGLVMVHGQELSSEYVKKFLRQKQKEQLVQVDKANRRGGRGRRSRKKTISDIGGMLSSPPPDELLMDASQISASDPLRHKKAQMEAEKVKPPIQSRLEKNKDPVIEISQIREPTTPGVFRKTKWDPFILSSPALQNMKKSPRGEQSPRGVGATIPSSNRLEKLEPQIQNSSEQHKLSSSLNSNKPLDWPPAPPF
uniref:Calmodulin n=4 Tax=Ditylum brightwellii TaxID=49249 RepID=A0A7S4VR08_9STRA